MLKTLILDGVGCGGQIMVTDVIENYPGFPEGVAGPELSRLMCQQAMKFGAEMRHEEVEGVEELGNPVKIVRTSEGSYNAKAIIITTGGSHKKTGGAWRAGIFRTGSVLLCRLRRELFQGRRRGGDRRR
jgi:thioredoxin reductase (NADPH)